MNRNFDAHSFAQSLRVTLQSRALSILIQLQWQTLFRALYVHAIFMKHKINANSDMIMLNQSHSQICQIEARSFPGGPGACYPLIICFNDLIIILENSEVAG